MRTDQIVTIARREYLTRVKSKGFWIATLVLPLAMVALVILPSLFLARTKATHRMTIVDAVGGVGERVATSLAVEEPATTAGLGDRLERDRQPETSRFEVSVVAAEPDADAQRAALDARVLSGEIDSWIRIDTASLAASRVDYRAESVSNFLTQRRLERALSRAFAETRLAAEGYDAARVVELTRAIDLTTLKVTEQGTTEEAGMAGFLLAYLLFFLLYLVVAIYGGLVMNGVLEEKSSRIVEVLLAATTAKELLYGKLFGIGAAGLTQLAVWVAAIAALTAPGVASALAFGAGVIPQVAPSVLVHFLLHFLLGFFLFAAMYAAIGAATNSVQEAQPLTGIVMPFLIAPMLFMMPVINDPDSTLAVVLSLVPMFTPLLMMLRIAVKSPPFWQIALGYALTTALVIGLMAVCARIYRVGILMYGKRPTFTELGRWIRRA
jgi:ABC-2 type transport system permease protein